MLWGSLRYLATTSKKAPRRTSCSSREIRTLTGEEMSSENSEVSRTKAWNAKWIQMGIFLFLLPLFSRNPMYNVCIYIYYNNMNMPNTIQSKIISIIWYHKDTYRERERVCESCSVIVASPSVWFCENFRPAAPQEKSTGISSKLPHRMVQVQFEPFAGELFDKDQLPLCRCFHFQQLN